jgi:hypothetical protein
VIEVDVFKGNIISMEKLGDMSCISSGVTDIGCVLMFSWGICSALVPAPPCDHVTTGGLEKKKRNTTTKRKTQTNSSVLMARETIQGIHVL